MPVGPVSKMRPLDPVSAAWNTVARFDDYETAQRAVDRLSDDGFPVEKLDIVGSELQLVERVTGRLTRGRAAVAGALTGLWAGLLFGILIGLFTTRGREPQACEACGGPFVCGATLAGCWCTEIRLGAEVRRELRSRYERCLCRACLERFAAGDAARQEGV